MDPAHNNVGHFDQSDNDDDFDEIMFFPALPPRVLRSLSFTCYPLSSLESRNSDVATTTAALPASVILPPDTLMILTRMEAQFPLSFKLQNQTNKKLTHCGVSMFTAETGRCYIPDWIMENLELTEGNRITLESVTLPKGTFALLEPQSVNFLDITDPKAVLEKTLSKFQCVSTGDVIPFHYNNKIYQMKILETKPASAISIIDSDLIVDFVQPVGYIEPKIESGVSTSVVDSQAGFVPFAGKGQRLDEKPVEVDNTKVAGTSARTRGIPDREYEFGSITFQRTEKPKDVQPNNDEEKSLQFFSGPGASLGRKKVTSENGFSKHNTAK